MSEEILKRLDEMESGIRAEISNNRTALQTVSVHLGGEVRRVEQKIDQHMEWEKLEHEGTDRRLLRAEKKVNDIRVIAAVNKAKLGIFTLLGGGSALGIAEIIRHFFFTTSPIN